MTLNLICKTSPGRALSIARPARLQLAASVCSQWKANFALSSPGSSSADFAGSAPMAAEATTTTTTKRHHRAGVVGPAAAAASPPGRLELISAAGPAWFCVAAAPTGPGLSGTWPAHVGERAKQPTSGRCRRMIIVIIIIPSTHILQFAEAQGGRRRSPRPVACKPPAGSSHHMLGPALGVCIIICGYYTTHNTHTHGLRHGSRRTDLAAPLAAGAAAAIAAAEAARPGCCCNLLTRFCRRFVW